MVVTAEQFRRLALSFPEAYESSHMDHPDFRVRGGKIFATLSHGEKWGMVKLTPEQQEEFVGVGAGSLRAGEGRMGARRGYQRAAEGGDEGDFAAGYGGGLV